MKKMAMVLAFISFAAHAELVSQGGFGIDGATNQSIPKPTSVKEAQAIYEALDVQAVDGKKSIELADGSSFECVGNNGCSFVMRASQNAKVVRGRGLSGKITFSGELATKIHKALPADTSGRVGASVKKVANLECVKPVVPRAVATCTIKDTHVISLDVEI